VSGQSRALPICNVRDVAQADALESLPSSANWIRGALPLRGARVPVVDLALRLGQAPTGVGESSCVVIAEVETARGSVCVGLLADENSRVTSARLPRWAILSVDELLDHADLREASAAGAHPVRAPLSRPACESEEELPAYA
jgi:chemotaxis signal transduction protein